MKRSVPFIVGNWKMNPVTLKEASKLAADVVKKNKKSKEPYVGVAPPFAYLDEVRKKVSKSPVSLVAQDVSAHNVGAFTGEISALQLKDLGVEYVIIGHSSKRAAGETDEDVQEKVLVTLKNKLVPIVCVGENKRDDKGDFFTFVERQLRSLAKALKPAQMRRTIVAYEPIWAISSTKNAHVATPEDAREMKLFIEKVLTKIYDRPTAKAVRILYGGSANPTNVLGFYEESSMEGFLVGGASLKANDFSEMIEILRDNL